MEPNKRMGLGERILDGIDIDGEYNGIPYRQLSNRDQKIASNKRLLALVINDFDTERQLKIDEENLSIGTIDAIDDLIQRAINKVEEASMLFTKAMYKTNK